MKTGNMRHTPGSTAVGPLLALIVLFFCAASAVAQSYDAEPQDLEFEIVNATTGQPGTVEKMTIDYETERRNNVAEFNPEGSTFLARGVPVLEAGKYIITVWHQGVPYWWSKRGRDLTQGKVTLHVFDTTDALDNVMITGLNLVIRRQESLLNLEYMLQIMNVSSPQATILGRPSTFELALPSGATDIQASYNRGPDPMDIALGSPGRRTALEVPLTPGTNQIRIVAVVPWAEGMEIPVGSNLPVNSWSVLASPEWLEVRSTDMEENDSEKVTGFRRFAGFPLDSGEAVDLRLGAGEKAAGPAEDLFTGDAPAEQADGESSSADTEGGGMSLPLIFVGVLIIVVIIAAVRRRS